MRLLCDHNAGERYVETFRRTEWLTVATVRDELSADTDDTVVSEYAEQHEWVVFTEDDDYLDIDHDRGLVRYGHLERPSSGETVDALRRIADSYDDHRTIEEYVPGAWV